MKWLCIAFICCTFRAYSLEPEIDIYQKSNRPKRIIRTCCSFGVDIKLTALPFVKFTDIMAVSDLGSHHYLGGKGEGIGIIYTHKGGFIDVGHARDMADWTGYFYKLLKASKTDPSLRNFKLGYEGGKKTIRIHLKDGLTDIDLAFIASKMAYDISVWHEIGTWYGTSYLPLIPERYSSFSVEDAYSNLLGAIVGREAILSALPFEEAVTAIIAKKIMAADPVSTYQETLEAMNAVKEQWWSDKYKMPSGKVLIKRFFNVYSNVIFPILLPNESTSEISGLEVPYLTASGIKTDENFSLELQLNGKFPKKKNISQREFNDLIINGTSQNGKKFPVDKGAF